MLEHIVAVAQKAGEKIMAVYAQESIASRVKNDMSPVTEADMIADESIRTDLVGTNIPILSEEGELQTDVERVWIVDPLDGTKDFMARSGDFSVMIALIEHHLPVLAVVHAPALGVTYTAERGKGTFVKDDRLQVSSHQAHGGRFVASAHHFSSMMVSVGEALHATVTRRGSNGIKAGLVARGEADYMFNDAPLSEWDIAAPHLIITEAGGTVTDIQGNPIRYGNLARRSEFGFVGSNGVSHAALLDAIRAERAH